MVCRYESGSDAPSVEILARAASVLEVEFTIHGYRLVFHNRAGSPKPQSRPQQLHLDFGKARTYRSVLLRITPRKGKLLIYAEVPA